MVTIDYGSPTIAGNVSVTTNSAFVVGDASQTRRTSTIWLAGVDNATPQNIIAPSAGKTLYVTDIFAFVGGASVIYIKDNIAAVIAVNTLTADAVMMGFAAATDSRYLHLEVPIKVEDGHTLKIMSSVAPGGVNVYLVVSGWEE